MAPSEKGRNIQTSWCSVGRGREGNIRFPLLHCRAEPKPSMTDHCARLYLIIYLFIFKHKRLMGHGKAFSRWLS